MSFQDVINKFGLNKPNLTAFEQKTLATLTNIYGNGIVAGAAFLESIVADSRNYSIVFEENTAEQGYDSFGNVIIKIDYNYVENKTVFLGADGQVHHFSSEVMLVHELTHGLTNKDDPEGQEYFFRETHRGDMVEQENLIAVQLNEVPRLSYLSGTSINTEFHLNESNGYDYTPDGGEADIVYVDQKNNTGVINEIFLYNYSMETRYLVVFGDAENKVTSSYSDDFIHTNGGNDTVGGWYGNDYLDGGSDKDTLNYVSLPDLKIVITYSGLNSDGTQTFKAGSYADNSADPAGQSAAWEDKFLNFEHVIGTYSKYDLIDLRDSDQGVTSPDTDKLTIDGKTIEFEDFEYIYGTSADDVIRMDKGHHFITDGRFNSTSNDTDTLYGGTGADVLISYNGQGNLYGGTDSDRLYVVKDHVDLYGGEGNDVYDLSFALVGATATIHLEEGFGQDAFHIRDAHLNDPVNGDGISVSTPYFTDQIIFTDIDPATAQLVWDWSETQVNPLTGETQHILTGAAEIRFPNGDSLYIPRLWGAYEMNNNAELGDLANASYFQSGLPDLVFVHNGQTITYSGSEGYAELFGRPLPPGTPNGIPSTPLSATNETAVDNHLNERETPDDGTSDDDQETGDDQSNIFASGPGSDSYDGRESFDVVSYEDSWAPVSVNLAANTASGGHAAGDSFTSIEGLAGSAFDDTLIGDAVANTLDGNAGNDTMDGGDGDDTLNGGAGGDSLTGGLGVDTINGGSGFDTIYGGDGNDMIDGGGQADTVYGGSGDDHIEGGQGFDGLHGDDGNDTLFGGETVDRLYGGTGADMLYGGSNFGSTIEGLWGGEGTDSLYGGAGFDMLDGGDGDDHMDGGHQADNLYGRGGNDTMYGDLGFDRLFGGNGDDVGYGGDSGDGLFGGTGNDTLYGDAGDDRFFGGTGNDTLYGGNGNDTMYGGAGFDVIYGGTGDDVMQGNFNADTFVFEDGHGNDTITDFNAQNDFEVINLSAVTSIDDIDDVLGTGGAASQVGADVVIDTGGGNSITLTGVTLSDLDSRDFIF